MSTPEQRVVLEWHAALNAGDVARVLALSTDDVEVGGPRGTGRGATLLQDWLARANIRLEPGRMEQHGARLVVEEQAAWSGGTPQPVASLFEVKDGRVARVIRYADIESAREAAGG
jgi:ketosteroid isomerase-like protein